MPISGRPLCWKAARRTFFWLPSGLRIYRHEVIRVTGDQRQDLRICLHSSRV